MAGDDETSANIESLNAALADAEIKAAAGDRMYVVRANFLRQQLAAISMPSHKTQSASLPQSVRMAALNAAHDEAQAHAKSEGEKTQKNFGGSTQVTVVSDATSDNCPTDPAGAAPHAPNQATSRQKGDRFSFRMPEGMKPKLEAKAAAAKTYPSRYVLELLAADLRVPIDEERLRRGRELQEEIAALTVALNRQGNNINQIAKATHEGKPSPLTRPEISQLVQQHSAAVSAILRLGFD